MNWVYFLHLETLPAWLAMPREGRQIVETIDEGYRAFTAEGP